MITKDDNGYGFDYVNTDDCDSCDEENVNGDCGDDNVNGDCGVW